MCFILVSVSHLSGSDKCNLATLKANSKWNNREETIHNSGQLLLQTSVRIQCFMHFLESTWHLSIGNWNECKYTKCLETCFEALTLTHCFTIIIRSQEISVQSHWPRGEGREGSEGMERGGGRVGRCSDLIFELRVRAETMAPPSPLHLQPTEQREKLSRDLSGSLCETHMAQLLSPLYRVQLFSLAIWVILHSLSRNVTHVYVYYLILRWWLCWIAIICWRIVSSSTCKSIKSAA